MSVTEFGFDNRATKGTMGYGGPIHWVVVTGGDTITVKVNENNFARKHLLLPSAKGGKVAGLFDWYSPADWINYLWYGVQPKVDAYAEDKARNRTAHRANVAPFAGHVAAVGAPMPAGGVVGVDNQRWSEKYRGNPQPAGPADPIIGPLLPVGTGANNGGAQGNRNSVINLISQSKNSIEGKIAATTFATTLGALPAAPGAVNSFHDHGAVAVDFGKECVINTEYTRIHRVSSVTGYAQGVTVGVRETVTAVANARVFSVYHLIGTIP